MSTCLLETRSLSHRFPDGSFGLKDVTLSLWPGQFVILAGRNGSGKTLLARHLIGLVRPSAGEISFMGRPLSSSLRELRRSVGMVFQDADSQVVGASVEDDLRFGLENLLAADKTTSAMEKEDLIRARVAETLAALDLERRRLVPPWELSGGEKRRLAIGGVLVTDPGLVILDEPFANLDFPGVVSVLKLIVDMNKRGRGILLITHELEKALAHAQRLVIMEEGAIKEDGPPVEVAARAGRYGIHPLDFSRLPLEGATWLP